MLAQIGAHRGGRDVQAIRLCGAHLDQLTPAAQERVQRLDRDIGQWPGRRPNLLPEAGQQERVESIGLGELPNGAGERPDPAGPR